MKTPNPFPTPNEWLANVVEQRKISRRWLAQTIGKTHTQVVRWINNREQIPFGTLAEIVRQIAPDDFEYVLGLKNREELVKQLGKSIQKFADYIDLTNTQRISEILLQYAENLVVQEELDPNASVRSLLSHLTDATFAVHLAWQTVANRAPLVAPTNVARHLRYPVNHFVGLLLNLGPVLAADNNEVGLLLDFREDARRHLRDIVRNSERRNPAEDWVRQHAIHLLARSGAPLDRDFIKEVILSEDGSADPMTERLGFVGLLLADGKEDTAERYLAKLRRDDKLAHANLVFDAIHYGDIHIGEQGDYPSETKGFHQSIPQILRHIEQPELYRSILDIECITLIHLLDHIGNKPFMHPQVLLRLHELLSTKAYLLPNERSAVRKEFDRRISQILNDGRRQGAGSAPGEDAPPRG